MPQCLFSSRELPCLVLSSRVSCECVRMPKRKQGKTQVANAATGQSDSATPNPANVTQTLSTQGGRVKKANIIIESKYYFAFKKANIMQRGVFGAADALSAVHAGMIEGRDELGV